MSKGRKFNAPKFPYESTSKRVPVPVAPHIQEIIEWCRIRLKQKCNPQVLSSLPYLFVFVDMLKDSTQQIQSLCDDINNYEKKALGSELTPTYQHDRSFIHTSIYKKLRPALYKTSQILQLDSNRNSRSNENTLVIEKNKIGAPKAPYTSTHKRVPIPVANEIQDVIDWYRIELRAGIPSQQLPKLHHIFSFATRLEETFAEIQNLSAEVNEYEREALTPFIPDIHSQINRTIIENSELYNKLKIALYNTNQLLGTYFKEDSLVNTVIKELPPLPSLDG